MENTRERPQFDDKIIDQCTAEIRTMIERRLQQKGRGIYVSSHETYGILMEEVREFEIAVVANSKNRQRGELLDIAVAALAGMASIDSGKMDW